MNVCDTICLAKVEMRCGFQLSFYEKMKQWKEILMTFVKTQCRICVDILAYVYQISGNSLVFNVYSGSILFVLNNIIWKNAVDEFIVSFIKRFTLII